MVYGPCGGVRVDGRCEMAAGAQINGKMVHQGEAPRRLMAPEAEAVAATEPAKA